MSTEINLHKNHEVFLFFVWIVNKWPKKKFMGSPRKKNFGQNKKKVQGRKSWQIHKSIFAAIVSWARPTLQCCLRKPTLVFTMLFMHRLPEDVWRLVCHSAWIAEDDRSGELSGARGARTTGSGCGPANYWLYHKRSRRWRLWLRSWWRRRLRISRRAARRCRLRRRLLWVSLCNFPTRYFFFLISYKT